MVTSRISPKGQVSLPKQVRDALGLHAGDRIGFVIEDGTLVLVPIHARRAADLLGTWGSDAGPSDVASLRAARVEELVRRYRKGEDR